MTTGHDSPDAGPSEKSDGKPVIAISLLREIAQAISHLSPDRALRFLVESAVSVTESRGAVLMTPHEKLREMVPLIEHLPPERNRDLWENHFPASCYNTCYKIFMEGHTLALDPQGIIEMKPEFAAEVGHALAMPVRLAGRPMGLLFIFRAPQTTAFNEEHLSFLEILTPFMGTLIENVLLHTEMIHKNSRLSALYEISQRTESLIDLRDVYDSLGEVVRSFTDLDVFSLYLLNPDGVTLETRNPSIAGPFPPRVRKGEGPVGRAANEGKPLLTFTDQYKSVLILPMVVSGKAVGVVAIGSKKPYAYRDEDIIGLRIITTQIASIDVLFKDLLRLRGFTQHIMQSMNAGVLIFDNNGILTSSNPAMAQLLARPIPEGISPFTSPDLFPAQLHKLMIEVLESKLALEIEKIRLDDMVPPLTLEVNAFPFRDETGIMLGTAFFFKDITQLIRLEDQLKRADRLSALGVLAAGIAHEIRNPLTGMKMIVQLLQSEFPVDDPKREPLGIIQNEIDRLERIIVNLLDFARPVKPQLISLNLPDILTACLLLLKNQLNKTGLKLETLYPKEIPSLVGDPDQLKQVFLNILTNAIQASQPGGGSLSVTLEVRPGWVVTSIKDSGIGIRAELLKGIFDPFMTTKEDGTGLGLSVALRIVEEHGGRIEVESTLGTGSTFSIHLPHRQLGEKSPGSPLSPSQPTQATSTMTPNHG
ncbi:MAG: ATP-binding protein [Candidatus Ozemobacteraceae bacterium]